MTQFRKILPNDYSNQPIQPTSIPVGSSLAVLGAMIVAVRSRFQCEKDDSIRYIWSTDNKKTDIFIGTDLPEDVEDQDTRPSILIGRGDIQTNKVMIGDRMGENRKTGKEAFYNIVAAPFTFTCRSTQKGEAEILANIVYEWLLFNEDIFRRTYQFHDAGPYILGSESPYEKQTTIRQCVVSARYSWDFRWTNKPKAQTLGDITLTLAASVGLNEPTSPTEELLIKVITNSFNR